MNWYENETLLRKGGQQYGHALLGSDLEQGRFTVEVAETELCNSAEPRVDSYRRFTAR
jgi:hypothetical protein